MTADLSGIRPLLAGITPGKWEVKPFRSGFGGDPERQPDFWEVGESIVYEEADAAFIAAAPSTVARLLGIVERVEALASAWEARGEHDMKFSKTIPDEDIAMAILTEGASMVENARHIRNAIKGDS